MRISHYFCGEEVDYGWMLAYQYKVHEELCTGRREGCFLYLSHRHVISMGRHSHDGDILESYENLSNRGYSVWRVDRGGGVTWHGPGQLVVYGLLPLKRMQLGVGEYIERLSLSVQQYLEGESISAVWEDACPGLWCGDKKICAIGARIIDGCSLHGIALNVDAVSAGFSNIVACGLKERGVSSMCAQRGKGYSLREVAEGVRDKIHEVFEIEGESLWGEFKFEGDLGNIQTPRCERIV